MHILIEVLRNSRAPSSRISRCWIQCERHASLESSSVAKGQSPSEAIKIPNRIHRGPTDILKALRGTVRIEYSGPPYRFTDDPHLTPFALQGQKINNLAQAAGRSAAKWIRDEYPMFFQQVIADPPVECYSANNRITDETPVDEPLLLNKIKSCRMTDAIKVYELMVAKGMDISHQSRQALLEMLCYFNCKEPLPADNYEERFNFALRKKGDNSWTYDPLVEKIFDSIEPKDSAAYSALIAGMYLHGASEDANKLFEKARAENITLDIKVHNLRLAQIPHIYEKHFKKRDLCLDILKEMNSTGIKPDYATLNNAVFALTCIYTDYNYELLKQLLREFREQGVEPSLGIYRNLLHRFKKDLPPDDFKSYLQVFLKHLKGKELEYRHPMDHLFFIDTMSMCEELQYVEGAIDVLNIAHSHYNKVLLGSFLFSKFFYNSFMVTIIRNSPVEVAMEWFKKLLPHHLLPVPATMEAMLDAFETFGTLEHLAPFWSECMRSQFVPLPTMIRMLGVAVSLSSFPIPLAEEVKPQLAELAEKVWILMLEDKTGSLRFTKEMGEHLLVLFAQAHRWQLVQAVLEMMHKEGIVPVKIILQKVITCCIEVENIDMAVWVTKFALNKFHTGHEQAKRLFSCNLLSEESKVELKQLLRTQHQDDSDSDTSSSSSSSESDGNSSDSDDDLSIPKKGKKDSTLPKPQ